MTPFSLPGQISLSPRWKNQFPNDSPDGELILGSLYARNTLKEPSTALLYLKTQSLGLPSLLENFQFLNEIAKVEDEKPGKEAHSSSTAVIESNEVSRDAEEVSKTGKEIEIGL